MKESRKQWSDRYAGHRVNERQAGLWRQQTQNLLQDAAPVYEGPHAAAAPEVIRNPWVENLPQRPAAHKSGVLIFLLLLAVLAGVSMGYWLICGVPDHGDELDDASYLNAGEEEISIPRTGGGSAQLTIVQAHGEKLTAQEIYQKVNPAAVSVVAAEEDGNASIGTGVLFTADGYLLTNAHVIDGGTSCTILTADGQRYEACLVGYDRDRDVAVLKASGAKDLPVAEIGDSNQLTVGDKVYAIGNPLGLELRGTLTDGIVSAINRNVQVQGRTMTLIQTNAALNAGNSGGPLINEYGQVVGLNAVKMSARTGETGVEGLGFAIPSRTVEDLTNQILRFGAPMELGISVANVNQNGETLDGLMVYSVEEDSCAEAAGLQPYDIILQADDQAVRTTEDLIALRNTHRPGEVMSLTVRRDDQVLTLYLRLRTSAE